MGTVTSIHLCETSLSPVFSVDAAHAIPGVGLEGDRISNDAPGETIAPHRQVTFIEEEALEALARDYEITMTAGESRRNIGVRGMALNHLVGREFTVGTARFMGIDLCEPCGTLERVFGVKGVVKGLIHRGGLRAQVLGEGMINVGDAVEA